jgi:hypothetical protein
LGYVVAVLNGVLVLAGGLCTFFFAVVVRLLNLAQEPARLIELEMGIYVVFTMLVVTLVVTLVEARIIRFSRILIDGQEKSEEATRAGRERIQRDIRNLAFMAEARLREFGLHSENILPQELFYRLANPAIKRYAEILDCIRRGEKSFSDVDYYRTVREVIKCLQEGDEIRAVCNDVNWNLPDTRGYFSANIEAADKGVSVQRIFITNPLETEQSTAEIISRHQKCGADVRLLLPSRMRSGSPELWVPPGVGFVIVKKGGVEEVFVHFRSDGPDYGKRYTKEVIVAVFVSWFNELYIQSDASPTVKA